MEVFRRPRVFVFRNKNTVVAYWVMFSFERWKIMKKFCAVMVVLFVSAAFAVANAQAVPSLDSIKSPEELTKAITALDKELFDAYNTCNLEKLGSLVADDLEFYHDLSGLATGK